VVLQKEEGDPILNRTLFLAFKKINQIHVTEEWMERATEVALLNEDDMITYLSEMGIQVNSSNSSYKPLMEYKTEEIPPVAALSLVNNLSLPFFRKFFSCKRL
jgi:hypothetical protein